MGKLNVRRIGKIFRPDPSRVIIKSHIPSGEGRIENIITRVLNLSDEEAHKILQDIIEDFSGRHKNIWDALDKHYNRIKKHIPSNQRISDTKRALLGAYFSQEYTVQSAAFFNPSIVKHPDQTQVPEGSIRFILSFRAVGEGHLSSIEFRGGIVDKEGNFEFDEVSPFVERAVAVNNPVYKKDILFCKLDEMHEDCSSLSNLKEQLSDEFNLSELRALLNISPEKKIHDLKDTVLWLAESNYELQFKIDQKLSERIVFPSSQNESNGIEDARFVRFKYDDGEIVYYATYTAYNGVKILPQILETKDFFNYKAITLNGEYAANKGMALFPKKINGKYMVISRVDGENLYIMSSENIHFWETAQILRRPKYDWEFMQIGNCGSPIETDKGWIVLTHGVGPMRKYCLGAILLDLEDPAKVIGATREPILEPLESERNGYVPNVVYSCGGIVHGDNLIIPYAMSDTNSGIALVSVKELLDYMLN
ncbi:MULTISPECIES: glycosidase [Psychrilyobacter]|uniref:Glycosidase n=1 Tax=Psychrilyobacter piezotolerans TaxID=2293438 RepID=A0ABX9KG13_9FUSO|nr:MULTISPECIES: glycosidase [Psychrilyobacter]MCS5420980.1 glycosidase [Psychrilyobacter sp. S5]NDI78781.1 glycosidase [Psychrilyobacter piezotolerans]RDE60881.1 glycosidase [Psychrilyobacter sp. S5]REI40670.1 glycosidase [Psychrilyobacter piezotolerans]